MKTHRPFGFVSCAILLATSALLVGCHNNNGDTNTAFVKYEVEADGCTVKYVDNPRGYNFFIAKCPAESQAITYQRPSGKTSATDVTITTKEVESLEQKLAEVKAKQAALNKLTPEDKKLLGIK